jgi:uncharacterized protein (TIGR00255 family)
MTGYGRGDAVRHGRRFVVEIKSVNHRHYDVSLRFPHSLGAFEENARKLLADGIKRGKADVYARMESFARQDVRVSLNTVVADAYAGALRELAERFRTPDGVTLAMLAAYKDVFIEDRSVDDAAGAEIEEGLLAALSEALEAFNAMRDKEGASLRADILEKRGRILAILGEIKERAPLIAEEYARRLRERVAEALEALQKPDADEARILTEVALFIDRSCIDEELTRLDSHLAQLAGILNEDGAVGRKLDFLAQEINREANTMGAKSNDAALTRLVLELKSETEKIREQVQNIE